MADKITFYAIVGGGRTIDNPYGLVRRLEFDDDGFTDEALRKDFSWKFTPLIVEWEHGDIRGGTRRGQPRAGLEDHPVLPRAVGSVGQPLDS